MENKSIIVTEELYPFLSKDEVFATIKRWSQKKNIVPNVNYANDPLVVESLAHSFETKLRDGFFYIVRGSGDIICFSGMYYFEDRALGGHRTLVSPELAYTDYFFHTRYITPKQIQRAIKDQRREYSVCFNEHNKRIYDHFKFRVESNRFPRGLEFLKYFEFAGKMMINHTEQWVMSLDLHKNRDLLLSLFADNLL
ncbi:MAG: hypothetical protein ACLGGX_08270 [Bdellovibrionia bacterium]